MDDSRVLAAMRLQAWERAKGELQSMQHTYYDRQHTFEEFTKLLEVFIDEVENNGLYE